MKSRIIFFNTNSLYGGCCLVRAIMPVIYSLHVMVFYWRFEYLQTLRHYAGDLEYIEVNKFLNSGKTSLRNRQLSYVITRWKRNKKGNKILNRSKVLLVYNPCSLIYFQSDSSPLKLKNMISQWKIMCRHLTDLNSERGGLTYLLNEK